MARFLGRYELLRPLARGGMAEVWVARQRGAAGVEKRLVVKRIRRERASDPRFLSLFVDEARLSVSLVHANIVPVFDFGRAGDELFLVMEYVEGCDLGAALARARERGRSLDPLLAAYVAGEACEALGYAHARGVIHRDVTPRNVLLSRAGEVKLADFGVALVAVEEQGAVRGTPAYMSPEQARGEAVDARADLFSLGLVLWEILAGRRAYDAPDARAALALSRAGEVPPLPDSVPEPLRIIVETATRADRTERPADARSLQQSLDGFMVRARATIPDAPAPARGLVAWLDGLEVPDASPAAGAEPDLPGGPVLTFADDGPDRLMGSGTARSLAQTAGSDAGLPPAPIRRTRLPLWAAGLAFIGGLAGAVWWASRREVATAPPDAAIVAPIPDAVTSWDATPPPDAAAPPTPDAAPPPPPRPAILPRRRLELNSTPWAYVWIDGGARRYQTPFSVELTPGRHTLRLENPVGRLERRMTIDVPRDRDLTLVVPLEP